MHCEEWLTDKGYTARVFWGVGNPFPSTQIQVVSATNASLARASCGTEGFRNAKKGTGIAAQTAGIAAAAVST